MASIFDKQKHSAGPRSWSFIKFQKTYFFFLFFKDLTRILI